MLAGCVTPLVLQNGWTNYGFGANNAGYSVVNGIVHMRGAIRTAGTNTLPFTLPPDARPATNVYVPVNLCNAQGGRLNIQPNGTVNVEAENAFSNAQCFTSLDGVTYATNTSGFTPLSLTNGWTNGPFGTSNAAVRNDRGIIHFKGAIATTGSNNSPFSMPVGFRPAANVWIPIDLCTATKGRLLVQPTGVVTVQAETSFANAQCFTSLDGASFALNASGFTNLPLVNGWTNAPSGTSNAAVRNDSSIVQLKGAVSTGTTAVITTLPLGFRPATTVWIPVDLCNAHKGRLMITQNGVVQVQHASLFSDAQCFTSLDGASFFVDTALDSDGDRLPNVVETNSGHFVNAVEDTGTNPNVADTDADGIKDGDEVLTTNAGLQLWALGANPVHKNLFLEFDWFDDSNDGCGAHSHRPTSAQVAAVQTAFRNAPVSNPDGVNGVQLIADYGQGGPYTGGNFISDSDGVIAGGVNDADFNADKTANFAANRKGFFHYVLLTHRYDTTSASSGQAEINGNDLVVSLQCSVTSTAAVANTIMHELGHNLGLRHGGDEDKNYKPDYNSVMNYRFQFPGIDSSCDALGDGVLNYSIGSRINLDENNLNEAAGVCGNAAIDWNGNLFITGGVSQDLNGDGVKDVLHDWNDWGHLSFGGLADSDGARIKPEVVTEQPVPAGLR
jgi:hypothetical protein